MSVVAASPAASAGRAERRIFGAAAILLSGMAVSRAIGLLREVVIGARFGTGGDLDLYVAAFRIPDTVFTLVAGGALGSTLVPVFAEYLESHEEGKLARLASAVFNLVTAAGCVAALLGIVFAPQLARGLGAGFAEPERQARLVLLVRIMLLQPVLFGMSEVPRRYLNVHHHFLYPAVAPALYNLGIIASALVLGPSMGTLGLAVGVVAGALAYLLVQLPAAAAFGFRWRPGFDLHDPGLRKIAALMLPRLVGQGAVQLSFIVTTRLASFLPEGRLSALNFAWVLMMLPLGIFAMPIADAALPTLSGQAARGERAAMAATVRRTLGAILFLMVPSAIVLIGTGLPLVQTALQRGRFDAESSALTAVALAFYAAGLPAHGAIEILTRSFYALHDTRTPVAVGAAAMVANILLAIAMVGPLGHLGIALAMSISASAEALVLVFLLRPRLPGLLGGGLFFSLTRTAIAAVGLLVALVPAAATLRIAATPSVVQLAGAVTLGGVVYVVVAFILRAPELHSVLRVVRAKVRR
jgi:putative peptidoglycan lipid II flippase